MLRRKPDHVKDSWGGYRVRICPKLAALLYDLSRKRSTSNDSRPSKFVKSKDYRT